MCNANQRPRGAAPARLVDGGNIPLGVVLVVVSSMLFTIGGAATKLLSTDVPAMSALIWRNILSAVGITLWFTVAGWPRLRSSRIDLHVARGLATFAGLWTYFWAVATIPLSTAVLLRTASPVFVPLVAYALYRRRSDGFVWIGAWIGLAGVALVVEPTGLGVEIGELLGIASGLLGAVGAVLIWRLGGIDGVATQLVWLTGVGLACAAVAAPWYMSRPATEDWPLIVAVAATTTASQIVLAKAFKVAPADKTITWAYLSVVFGGALGVVVWSEIPTTLALAGMGLVIVGSHLASLKPAPRSG